MSKPVSPELTDLIHRTCQACNCSPVEIVMRGSAEKPVLEVYIDALEAITVDKCRDVAAVLNEVSESNDLISTTTIITVSSPGVDRPLVHLWQFPKHTGRNLSITRRTDDKVDGVLKEVGDESLTIEQKIVKKGSKPMVEVLEIPFAEVREATVTIVL